MTDTTIRRLTAAAVLVVAAVAAVVSFQHIETLATSNRQPPLSAYLLPVSIDGTVVAASLTMLRAARNGHAAPALARLMLGLAVAGTVAANVLYGAPNGLTGAFLSAAPAVFFVGSVEMAVGMARRGTAAAKQRRPATSQPATAPEPVRPPATTERPQPRPDIRDTEAAALSALAANPHIPTKELAAAIGQSERNARRVRAKLNGGNTP